MPSCTLVTHLLNVAQRVMCGYRFDVCPPVLLLAATLSTLPHGPTSRLPRATVAFTAVADVTTTTTTHTQGQIKRVDGFRGRGKAVMGMA